MKQATQNHDVPLHLHTRVYDFFSRYPDYDVAAMESQRRHRGDAKRVEAKAHSALRRECERLTDSIVSFFEKVQGIEVLELTMDFILNPDSKLVLHDIAHAEIRRSEAPGLVPTLSHSPQRLGAAHRGHDVQPSCCETTGVQLHGKAVGGPSSWTDNPGMDDKVA